jgi:hypothetical protein
MTNQHPITSPPELVEQWSTKFIESLTFEDLVNEVARWGADQELEECCDHIRDHQWGFVDQPDGTKGMHRAVDLKLARRPKPPTLKEQALAELEILRIDANTHGLGFDAPAIRRALEALPQ